MRLTLHVVPSAARLRRFRAGQAIGLIVGVIAICGSAGHAFGPDRPDAGEGSSNAAQPATPPDFQDLPEQSDPVEPAETALEPGQMLELLRSRYSQAPFAERVTLEVLDEQGRVRTAWYLLRADPSEGTQSFRLDLGELAVHAVAETAGTRLTAVHSVDRSRFARARTSTPIGPEALKGFVPPVVAPSLWLAFASSSAAEIRWTPFTHRVEWQEVVLDAPEGEEPDDHSDHPILLLGRSGEHTIEATIDPETHRLLGLLVRDREGAPRLRLLAEPIEAGDPDEWAVDTDGREAVDDVRRLRRTHRPVAIGDPFPLRSFLDPEAGLWSLDESLESEAPRARAESVAVLAFYAASDGGADEQSAARRRASRALGQAGTIVQRLNVDLRERAESRRGPSIRLIPRAVGVFEINAFSSESLQDEVAFWAERRNAGTAPGFVWTIAREESLDRLVRGADAALAVIDARGELVEVISLLGPEAQPDHLETDLERAIRRASWPLFTPGTEPGGG